MNSNNYNNTSAAQPEKAPEQEKSLFVVCREIVESVVVAFVLALMFRTYIAEAFMIPTGSMANELMGRHKDIYCPECGFRFKVGATEEISRDTGAIRDEMSGVVCPNCRVCVDLASETIAHRDHPSYGGDRIIVGKYPYRIGEPNRWDVFVFMFPGNTQTNYIKRLVGLPNETLRVKNGDILVRPLDKTAPEKEAGDTAKSDDGFTIARKPPEKILAVMQNVYDNNLTNEKFFKTTNWPRRWVSAAGSTWEDIGMGTYSCKASQGEQINWLTYQHVVPTYDILTRYYNNSTSSGLSGILPHIPLISPAAPDTRPALITDMNAYNYSVLKSTTESPREYPPSIHAYGLNWVSDLIIQCSIKPEAKTGKAYLQLVKGGVYFTATIDLESGQVTLSISGQENFKPVGKVDVSPYNKMKLRFCNVDQSLYLWQDDKLVQFDQKTTYDKLDNDLPTVEDLRPVRIGVANCAAEVSSIKLFRDLYYIAADRHDSGPIVDFNNGTLPFGLSYGSRGESYFSNIHDAEDFYRNPARWGFFANRRAADFTLEKDQFFAMGDNSSNSEDSRLWGRPELGIESYVSRDLLIGRAQFVFWPHAYNVFVPNLGDMRRIK